MSEQALWSDDGPRDPDFLDVPVLTWKWPASARSMTMTTTTTTTTRSSCTARTVD